MLGAILSSNERAGDRRVPGDLRGACRYLAAAVVTTLFITGSLAGADG